jgi:hypothetical protein
MSAQIEQVLAMDRSTYIGSSYAAKCGEVRL